MDDFGTGMFSSRKLWIRPRQRRSVGTDEGFDGAIEFGLTGPPIGSVGRGTATGGSRWSCAVASSQRRPKLHGRQGQETAGIVYRGRHQGEQSVQQKPLSLWRSSGR